MPSMTMVTVTCHGMTNVTTVTTQVDGQEPIVTEIHGAPEGQGQATFRLSKGETLKVETTYELENILVDPITPILPEGL